MNKRTTLLILTVAEEEALEVALKHKYPGKDELQLMTESQLIQSLRVIHGPTIDIAIPAFGRWIGTEFYVFGRTDGVLVTRLDEEQATSLYYAVLGLVENPKLTTNAANIKTAGSLLDKIGKVCHELEESTISLF